MSHWKAWGLVVVCLGALGIAPVACSGGAAIDGQEETIGTARNDLIQVPANGGVITLAGNGMRGAADATVATNGSFNDPAGVAVATDGTIYVADWGNNSIRRIKPDGSLDTFIKGEPNLIKNPRAEEPPSSSPGVPQWGNTGTWVPVTKSSCSSCLMPFDGTRFFWPGSGAVTSMSQNINSLEAYRTAIDAGQQTMELTAAYRTGSVGASTPTIVALFSAPQGVTACTMVTSPSAAAPWKTARTGCTLPKGTTSISIQLNPGGNDTYFDNLQLRPLPGAITPASGDAGLVAPTALAFAPNGNLYVGEAGLPFTASANQIYVASAIRAFAPDRTEVAPGFPVGFTLPTRITNIASAPDGALLFIDSLGALTRVRGPAGNWYYADLQTVPNTELLGAGVTVVNGNYRLMAMYRGSVKIYTTDCPISSASGVTVTCTGVASAPVLGYGKAFVDDTDGTAGGERFSYMNTIANGKFGDIIIADEGNNAVRRFFYPFTVTAAGTGLPGFSDGPAAQAAFFSPSSVAVTPDGGIVVADRMNNRIRKILCGGTNVCAASGGQNQCPVVPLDDGNSCTTDTCSVVAVQHDTLPNGSTCTDNNACTSGDVCSAGACAPGTPTSINDNNACTVDACNTTTGSVSHTPNYTDSDPTDCRIPTCNATTGAVTYVNAPEGTPCGAANSGRRCGPADPAVTPTCELPAPVYTAPALDTSRGTDFDQVTSGIWNAASPIQKNPDGTKLPATKFEPGHAGWLFGYVKTDQGLPLSNVVVTIANDSGYGQTLTRDDGRFDLIVNGGRNHTVRFTKSGHLPVDRQVYVGWEENQSVPPVIMLTADANATTVTLTTTKPGTPPQTTQFTVASGTASTDADGTRTAKLMLPVGLTATMNGQALSSMKLRLTEYTVGTDGPARMPATLPPTSAYTYAVEISADEALNANGAKVTFNTPAYAYVDNFLSTTDPKRPHPPAGTLVPSGYYDRAAMAWVPSASGVIIKILKGKTTVPAASPAEIDVTGDDLKDDVTNAGAAADIKALGFTAEELIALREYADGATLWRVPIDHMTPFDFNFAGMAGCTGQCQNGLASATPPKPPTCEATAAGSIIGCESQTLGETLAVPGTPFSLNYNSGRLPLYSNWRTMTLGIRERPVPPPNVTASGSIELTIAGKLIYARSVGYGPAEVVTVNWDGNDVFGRPIIGSATATLESRWAGTSEWMQAIPIFNRYGHPQDYYFVRQITPFSQVNRRTIQIPAFSPPAGKGSWSLGGWTLSAHHFYDAKSRIIYFGSGKTKEVDPGLYTIKRLGGSGGYINGVAQDDFAPDGTSMLAPKVGVGSVVTGNYDTAVAPNGDVYFIDPVRQLIRKLDSNGIVKTVAGKLYNGGASHSCNANGDGQSATAGYWLASPRRIAFGPGGELYIYDDTDREIRVLRPTAPGADTYTIDTVAGKCPPLGSKVADGVPAKGTAFNAIADLAVSRDGYIYFADEDYYIRRFKPGGTVEIIAGNNTIDGTKSDPALSGKLATQVSIGRVYALDVGPDGSVYATSNSEALFRVRPDGTIEILSGRRPGTYEDSPGVRTIVESHALAEGVSFKTDDYIENASRLAVGTDGQVYFNDTRNRTALRALDPSGIVKTISKAETNGAPPVDGAAALARGVNGVESLALAPDGSIIVGGHNSIYRIFSGATAPAAACGDAAAVHFVPDGDQAYCFDKNGQHLSTVNWRTGARVLTFRYDANGRLDAIEADPQGRFTAAKNALTQVYDVALNSDASGNKSWAITSPFGQATTIDIDGNDNATKIWDSLGNTQMTPARDGHLQDFTDRNGNPFSFTFVNGLLTEDKSPLSLTPQTLTRTDIAGGFRVTHTTPLNRVTTHDQLRSAAGLLTQITTFPDLTQAQRAELWDKGTKSTAPDGTTISQGTPAADPIVGLRDPVPGPRTIQLPTGGLSLSTSETRCVPVDNTSTEFIGTVRNGNPLACNSTPDPFSGQTSHATVKRTWTSAGETVALTSPEGRTVTQLKDSAGRVTQIQVGTLTPVELTYDPTKPAQLKFVKRGSRQEQRTYQTTGPDNGFVKDIVDALANTTEYTRDIYGRPTKVVEALGIAGQEGTTKLGWDGNGNLKLVTPPRVDPAAPLDTTKFDHNFTFDAINGVKQYSPPVVSDVPAPQTNYTPTADRTPLTETRPDGKTITYNLATTLGAQTGTAANLSDQIDTITFPNNASPTGKVDYDYYLPTEINYSSGQAPGKVKSVTGPYGTTRLSFEYNGSLVTKMTWQNVAAASESPASVGWGYSSLLLRNSETVSPLAAWTGKTVAQSAVTRYLSYDKDDLLTCNSSSSSDNCASLACTGGDCNLRWTRSAIHGAITDIAWGSTAAAADQLAEHWDYSDASTDITNHTAFGELRRQSLAYGVAPALTKVADIVYDSVVAPRDALGRISVKTETFSGSSGIDTAYDYDERGRLESVTKAGALVESFGYDTNGNRTSCTSQGVAYVGVYDEQDRLSTYGASQTWSATGDIKYTYGKNGELAKREIKNGDTWDYTYDPLGNLTTVKQTGAQVNTFTYLVDGRGRRIGRKKQVGAGAAAVTHRWLYRDQLAPAAELDASGRLVSLFIYGSRSNVPDFVVKFDATGNKTTYRLFSDHLGSPRLAININDRTDVKYRVDYSAFGVVTAAPGTDLAWIPFGFAGGIYDKETGLVRFGARDYDPSIGRWVSKDPIGFGGGQTNIYVYAGNDPVNRFDPMGLDDSMGGSSGLGDAGAEGQPNDDANSTPACTGDNEALKCWEDCMDAQHADYAAAAFTGLSPFAPTPKTPWELGRTLGGGSSLTTWASRLSADLGMKSGNWLRGAGSVAGKLSAVPYAFAGGYYGASAAVCAAECG